MIKWQGTAYRFHPLFTLVLLFSVITGFFIEAITLFGIVLVHELGHVVCAKALGWRVMEVQLLPFGGVAVVDEWGGVSARDELLVAAAGPLQHVWMIGLAWLGQHISADSSGWWNYFIQANILIGLFNLLPVLPLDGGKILQGLFSYIMAYEQAIRITMRISFGLSLLMIGFALFFAAQGQIHLNLLMIGAFLLYSNWMGYRHVPYQFVRFLMKRGERTELLMNKGVMAQPLLVRKQQPIKDILKMFMKEKYHFIYVIGDQGQIHAILPEQRLIDAYFHNYKPGSAVSDLFM
ncbi:Zn-dependent protease [Paenibacillus larvae subsp. pulvifaciens]|uniref:Zn-dependent protease n=1 Tax=Paenibacillus larvae subsp. pulvifaciens TaxID=1477 RepID=A0A1V0UQX0_9BACL|nr:M50 family metallopeptidase [Paenibacillus larvae]ARF67420.1 Zn-dependent protease [Paenibacillus larvae subsp. pulvifaciens]